MKPSSGAVQSMIQSADELNSGLHSAFASGSSSGMNPIPETPPDTPSSSPVIRVTADDREAGGGVVEALRYTPGVEVEVRRLDVGDYEVDERCVFERKTLPDLVASIIDGRLFAQAARLAAQPKPSAFILEGKSADLAGSQMRREALQGALVTLALVFRVPVLRALDAYETARLLCYASRQLRWHPSGKAWGHGRRPKSKRRTQLRILQSLPGIGSERAVALLDRFGSVEAALTAQAEELRQTEGIGEKTAARLRWALSEAAGHYGPAD